MRRVRQIFSADGLGAGTKSALKNPFGRDGPFAFAKVCESVSGRASDNSDRVDDMAQQQPLYHSLGYTKNGGLHLL